MLLKVCAIVEDADKVFIVGDKVTKVMGGETDTLRLGVSMSSSEVGGKTGYALRLYTPFATR